MIKIKKSKYVLIVIGIVFIAVFLLLMNYILRKESSVFSSTRNQSTPDLIQQAFDRGEITDEQRLLYLAYAIYEYEALPIQFHSNVGWRGTSIIMDLHEAAPPLRICSMSPSIRSEFQRLLKPNITCD